MKLKEFLLNPPAQDEAVSSIARLLPAETPRDFFAFLQQSDGAEAWLEPNWATNEPDCIRIDSTVLMQQLRSTFAERYPDLLVIGSDAATKLIAYDMTQPLPWPIVIFDSDTEDFSSTIRPLAPDMTTLRRRFFSNETVA